MRRTTRFRDKDVEVDVVPFKVLTQDWNEYQLRDGTVLRVQYVVTEVQRFEGEYNPNGDPVYGVQGRCELALISIPDNLRKTI